MSNCQSPGLRRLDVAWNPREEERTVVEIVRVLIADSDPCVLDGYREGLAQDGLTVATAADGLQCLAQLRKFRPDVLVLDPSLPWGGGDGVLALLHDDPDLPQTAVIVLANRRDRTALYRLAQFHVEGYHVKPLDVHQLAARIQAIASQRRVGAQPA